MVSRPESKDIATWTLPSLRWSSVYFAFFNEAPIWPDLILCTDNTFFRDC